MDLDRRRNKWVRLHFEPPDLGIFRGSNSSSQRRSEQLTAEATSEHRDSCPIGGLQHEQLRLNPVSDLG